MPLVEIRPARPDVEPAPSLVAATVSEMSERYGAGVRVLTPGTAEIRRMFVATGARRRGVARGLLTALEEASLDLGCPTLRLETGLRQPEAIALYQEAGYERIPDFGYWADSPEAVCFEKPLG